MFWKVPNRKVFAVDEHDITRGSGPSGKVNRKRRHMHDAEDINPDVQEKMSIISTDLEEIKSQLKDVFRLTMDSNVPISLNELLKRHLNAGFVIN